MISSVANARAEIDDALASRRFANVGTKLGKARPVGTYNTAAVHTKDTLKKEAALHHVDLGAPKRKGSYSFDLAQGAARVTSDPFLENDVKHDSREDTVASYWYSQPNAPRKHATGRMPVDNTRLDDA